MANVGKWYTKSEYYDEEGIEITKREAQKHYIKIKTFKNVKINGNTGTITYWHICQRDKQQKIW